VSAAVLAIWVDIDPDDDAFFEYWHSREHAEERVSCPGWQRGSRFKGVDTPARYLLFYEAGGAADFESEVYYARLREPSTMSRLIFPKFRNTWRTVCTVEHRQGEGIGAAILAVRNHTAAFDTLAALGPVRIDLLKGEPAIGQGRTAEKDLRATPDRQIDRAVVAFFWSVEEARTARDRHAPCGEVFVLRHSVSKDDLAAASAAS
jgi:hypothetical protein